MEQSNKNKFLLLTGTYEYSPKKGKFVFPLTDGDSITSKRLKFIVDPTYDYTFMLLFGSNGAEERLKEMLNALLYPGEYPKRIRSLKFIPNEMHKLGELNKKNSLITDIACEIKVDGQVYVVAIEIQIGDKGLFTKRLSNYGTSLRNNNSFKDCFALGISVSSRVNSNYTKIKKETYEKIVDLNYIKTIQINVDYELSRMGNRDNIQINGKNLLDDGKEFLKLLGLRNWATKNSSNRFALPEWDISENSIINQCIDILSRISDAQLSRMILDQQYFEDIRTENFNAGIDEGVNKGIVIAAFGNFLEDRENPRAYNTLKDNDVQEDNKKIREMLKEKESSDVDDFIEYLDEYNFF